MTVMDAGLVTTSTRGDQLRWLAVGVAVAGGLVLASLGGPLLLVGSVALAQLVLVLGVLALVEAPGVEGALIVALGAAVASDVLAVLHDGELGGLAGVAGLAFVAALLHQLARRNRVRVTESLADTLVVVLLVQALACLPALRSGAGGREAMLITLAAAVAALVSGRLGDLAFPRPTLVAGSTRTWAGLVLSLVAGSAVAAAAHGAAVSPIGAALLGLAVAAALTVADLTVEFCRPELLASGRADPPVAALRRVGLLLPYALLAPVALLASRLVLS